MIGIDHLNGLDEDGFVDAVGFAFERSPWIARRAAAARPFADRTALHRALADVVRAAPESERIALIAAHPDLAGRVARDGRLTAASRGEQAAAGLDTLTPVESVRFTQDNTAYRGRFGFPFVICAREHSKESILVALRQRTGNAREAEIATAIAEIEKIARLRLEDTIS